MSINQGELLPSVDTEFKYTPVKWDPDLGTVPEDVRINEVVYTKFVQDDVVVYTDIPLSGLYDKTRDLNIDVVFETETGNAGDINWALDYMITYHGVSPSGTFTSNRVTTTRTSGNKLEKVAHISAIPSQPSLGNSGTLTLRFGRVAGALDAAGDDTLNDNVLVLGIQVYQGDL